jgi:hypothetical protein
MNRWRVGEDRGSKETDGCPLTDRDLDSECERECWLEEWAQECRLEYQSYQEDAVL